MSSKLDIVIIMNAKGLDTSCIGNVHRLPLIQALADKLKTTGKILVVAAPISFLTASFNDFFKLVSYVFISKQRSIGENLFILYPYTFLPVSLVDHWPITLKFFRNFMRHQLSIAMAKFGFLPTVQRALWVTHPYHVHYAGLVEEKLILYECYDDFTIFGQQKINKKIQRAEIKLAKISDLILATSEKMVQYFSQINSNTHYFSNAVDFALFNKAVDFETPLAESMKNIPKPIVGFTGNVSHHGLDYALLKYLIKNNPCWSFVFIGGSEAVAKKEVAQLRRLSGTYFLGWQNYYELPRFLKGLDVAIMPYKVDKAMQSVNPNKLYQFMAAGVPVASTPLPEVKRFEGIVEIGAGTAGFTEAIKRALNKKNKDDIDKMASIAFENSWENRAGTALGLIYKKLNG